MRLIKRTLEQIDSPISETYALLTDHAPSQPLLNLAQAAPSYPPPPEIVDHIAAFAKEPIAGAYAGIAGLDELRTAFAAFFCIIDGMLHLLCIDAPKVAVQCFYR